MTTKLITMMKNRDLFLQRMLFFAFAGILFYSCNPNPQASVTEESISNVKVDTSKTGIINVGGTLFSIPSPIQTAMLIKESNTEYDASILNSTRNLANYTSREIKALNLGIYGADLGYATIFEDNESAVNYLNTVEKLANDLEIIGALDKNILRRFANNVGNQDSMLILTSNFYRAGDAYLKDNETYGEFWELMHNEYQRSLRNILRVAKMSTLLEDNLLSKDSIAIRERIVLPLITIQQYAIQQMLETGKEDAVLQKLILRTMFGIINAARNAA